MVQVETEEIQVVGVVRILLIRIDGLGADEIDKKNERECDMKVGKKYLITTDNWFFAPDGKQYRSVFGTLYGIVKAEDELGLRPNRNSANWFVNIGNMSIAGYQIHFSVETKKVNLERTYVDTCFEGNFIASLRNSLIYNADQ